VNYGWVGKILRVNLTDRTVNAEDTIPKYAPDFLGGLGFCAKVAWDEIPAGTDPFSPENKLIIAPGVLTGTASPSSGRVALGGIAPGIYPKPTYTNSNIGGNWGAELKQAGYDGLILQGIADSPVYLAIHNGEAEVKDATELWGKDTYETQTSLQAELGDSRVKTLTIGPAGEKLARAACIMSGTGWAAGYGGFAAVMGSKKLKAISVLGSNRVNVARPKELLDFGERVRKFATMLSATPKSLLWADKTVDPADINKSALRYKGNAPSVPGAMRFVQKYGGKSVGCTGCPISCYVYIDVPGIGGARVHCMQWHYAVPRRRTDETVWESVMIQNKLGINAFEIYMMIPWLVAMNAQGLISESDTGIPFSAYPEREFIVTLLNKVGSREGFGDTLAEGVCRAAERIGEPALKWLLEDPKSSYGGYGMCIHDDGREWIVAGLQWATHSRDPFTEQHDYYDLVQWSGLSFEEQRAVSEKAYGSPDAVHKPGEQKYDVNEARATVLVQDRRSVKLSLGLCDWVYPLTLSPQPPYLGDTSMESKLFSAVTGIDTDEKSMSLAGERIWNLERAIMIREGRTRNDDTLPPHFFLNKLGKLDPIDKAKFEQLKDQYYNLRGWDSSGKPTRQKLEQLGLKDVADALGV
jgi:aldehyde:ferredoxin oxidoreductase